MLEALRSDQNLRRQVLALSAKLREYQASEYPSDHQKAWKLAAKIRRLEKEMANRQMLLFSGRL